MKYRKNINDCSTCKRNSTHGGGCKETFKSNCLIYDEDPRGEIVFRSSVKLPVPFHINIEKISSGKEVDYYLIEGINKKIKVIKIHKIYWNKGHRGGLNGVYIRCDITYWSNENLNKILEVANEISNKLNLVEVNFGKTSQIH